jgi:predicted acyltransferase
VLLAAGITWIVLGVIYWLIECKGWNKKWTHPWLVFGKNAIALYVFSELLASTVDAWHTTNGLTLKEWILYQINSHMSDAKLATLMYSLTFMMVCFLLAWYMEKKKSFVKV